MTNKTLMIIGMGDLAGLILNLLVQTPKFGKIILASKNKEEILLRKNLAVLFSAQLGYYHSIECIEIDLFDIAKTAEIIYEHKPDIIFNTATLQSWRIITGLPKDVFQQMDEAQFGPWLPMHLTLVYKLMLAVHQSGVTTKVVNAAFPDAVGAVLATKGLAPTTGIGNVANIIPALRGSIGLQMNKPLEEVQIALFTQHYFSHRIPAFGDVGGAPYYIQAKINEEDITESIDFDEVFLSVRDKFRRTGGAFRQLITASSALSVLLPMIHNQPCIVHAPAPNGLPGGYQVKISADTVEVALPEQLTLEQVIHINNECQKLDGIEKIDDDGTVYFTEKEMAIMKKMLGYECLKMPLADVDSYANELKIKYLEFASKFGNG